MTDSLNHALDRFDVPPMSAGLADRIMAAATSPSASSAPPRRDRRGMWRRGRQVVLGTLAIGLLSAGAVASGLLGKVGIEVPVLTAMLAPKPHPVSKAKAVAAKPRPAPPKAAPALEPTPPDPVLVLPAARPLLPAERMALRQDRRERFRAFAEEHPVAAARVKERVRERLQQRAFDRRQALMGPGVDPSLPGVRTLDASDRIALARAARRDRLIAERMIDRRLRARERGTLDGGPANPGPVVPPVDLPGAQPAPPQLPRADNAGPVAPRLERFRQMSPGQRGELRARVQQRRLLRLERLRQPSAN